MKNQRLATGAYTSNCLLYVEATRNMYVPKETGQDRRRQAAS